MRLYNPDGDEVEAAITVPTLEISVDMLKRYILRDSFVVKTLGLFLSDQESLKVGTVNYDNIENAGTFCAFEATESLKKIGLEEESIVWVCFA